MKTFQGRQVGFTLVELLIAILIVGLLSTFIANFFIQSTQTINQQGYVSTQTAVVQRAVGLIGDDVRRAEKIIPPGTALSLGVAVASNLNAPATTGPDRIDIYIVKPVGSPCTLATDDYEVRSYFTVTRAAAVSSTDTWVQLPDDPLNSAQKVLIQYKGCAANQSTSPSNGVLRLVSDYVNTFTLGYPSATGASIDMQAARTLQGQLLRSPLAPAHTTYYSRRF